MAKMKKARVSSLFLMELMFSVLFFSLAGAICVNLFVSSRMLSRRSQNLNRAVISCCSCMEALRVAPGLEAAKENLSTIYPQGVWQGEEFFLEGAGLDPSAVGGTFALRLSLREGENLIYASCEYLSAEGESIYTLNFTHWEKGD